MRKDLVVEVLERDAVLGSLCEYAADARRGDGRVVLVSGEAGVGKTTVLEILRDRLADARWLWGACDGSFTPRPLGPLFDVAGQVGGDLAGACRAEAPREQLFRALLDELTSAALTVLAIEDVHWADEATLDLIRFLAPRLRQERTLLVVTFRDDGLAPDHPLRVLLGELASQRTTRRIGLAPLSRDAVSRLSCGTDVPSEQLFALTGGNPFLVGEVLAAGTGEVPPSAREAVLARVARLSADARRVLEAAALIGTRVGHDVLAQVACADADAVDECLTTGALVSEATEFRFRHEIARLAVEQAVPVHRRAQLHARILATLIACGVKDDARLAHHAEGACDAVAVLRFAPRAAERAAQLAAHREAAAQYERALRFADAADPAIRASLYDALATEDSLIDRWEQSAQARQAALGLWQEIGDQVRVGDSLRLLSRTMWRLCRGTEAEAAAVEALDVLAQLPPSREHAWAYGNLAGFRMYRDDAEAIELARKTQVLAREFGDDALLSLALNTEGSAKSNLGENGVPELRKALDVALAIGSDEHAGRAYANLQAILASTFRLAEAESVFFEAVAYCDEHDIGTYSHCLRGGHAWVLDRLGRWDEAEAICTHELDRTHLSPINRLSPLTTLGVVRARRGHPDAARLLGEAADLVSTSKEPALMVEVGLACLEAAWLAGDHDRVRREAARMTDAVGTSGDAWQQGAFSAWLQRCRLDDARLPRAATPYASQLAGEWRAAADEWLRLGCPYDAGMALLDSGDEDGVREALVLFDELGATATVDLTRAALRRLGVSAVPRGRRADTRANRFGLTRREQEVLALICDGMTNADISARLFIAEKTVDNHVSSVLSKMGVRSRRAAARLADAAANRGSAT